MRGGGGEWVYKERSWELRTHHWGSGLRLSVSDGTSCSCPMETMVPGWMPRAGLLLLLLLCFGPETAGSINPVALKMIVDHVHQYRPVTKPIPTDQYAVAIALPRSTCQGTSLSDLQQHLPVAELKAMKSTLESETGFLYEDEHIVAAKPDKRDKRALHSEWLMLNVDQNGVSPVSRLLDKARGRAECQLTRALGEEFSNHRYIRWFLGDPCGWNGCFVFFTYYSPCLDVCLTLKDDHHIQQLMDGIFGAIEEDHRALAFKEVTKKDTKKKKQSVWNSWQTLCKVPMYQCDDQSCQSCEEKDVNKNSCLRGVIPSTPRPKIAHG